jgi:hypothetical protein
MSISSPAFAAFYVRIAVQAEQARHLRSMDKQPRPIFLLLIARDECASRPRHCNPKNK